MKRFLALALLGTLLAGCNSGESFLEWDPETQAMLDAQQAQADAARTQTAMTDEEILAQAQADAANAQAGAETGAAASAGTVPLAAGGMQAPLVLLDAQGAIQQGVLANDPQAASRIEVVWSDGARCSGGLVQEAGSAEAGAPAGTFALNCSDGTIWLGKYAEELPGQGAWAMRDAGGRQARAVYGSDVPADGLDAAAFEGIWSSRATTPEGA